MADIQSHVMACTDIRELVQERNWVVEQLPNDIGRAESSQASIYRAKGAIPETQGSGLAPRRSCRQV